MTILVTGCAGFIGYHTCKTLLDKGEEVVGIDSLNDYYDITLKEKRLEQLQGKEGFTFHRCDIANFEETKAVTDKHTDIDQIIHLAAQAGVRYSISHPFAYSDSNLTGHLTMLEICKTLPHVKHFVYASSSSVYGANEEMPFSVEHRVDHPVSLYAATKRSCELMSYAYCHLYRIPMTGLRYFTVYGPWGRPDMAAFIFTKAICNGDPFPVFNQGNMRRNFTYIDDVVAGTIGCLNNPPAKPDDVVPYKLYNIGNNRSEKLLRFIEILEHLVGKEAKIQLEPMQPGDVQETIADITASTQDFGFEPKTNIEEGLENFVNWYKEYYNV